MAEISARDFSHPISCAAISRDCLNPTRRFLRSKLRRVTTLLFSIKKTATLLLPPQASPFIAPYSSMGLLVLVRMIALSLYTGSGIWTAPEAISVVRFQVLGPSMTAGVIKSIARAYFHGTAVNLQQSPYEPARGRLGVSKRPPASHGYRYNFRRNGHPLYPVLGMGISHPWRRRPDGDLHQQHRYSDLGRRSERDSFLCRGQDLNFAGIEEQMLKD
ncbi:hypothetical protein GGR53DRAFT_484567 [Hypoxylon sp. FL1150]|nr:hypothetical protein GGR53DRAFT_484567 [Hypoxylon sp. FL1150]